MSIWTIEPRAPIILRDGRPFGLNPGARAETLDFPFPSTIAGAVRSQHWQQSGNRFDENFDEDNALQVNEVSVKGPLLVEVGKNGNHEWLMPVPGDAVVFGAENDKDNSQVRIRQLVPMRTGSQTSNDLGISTSVQMVAPIKEKPHKRPPKYWRWDYFQKWLVAPSVSDGVAINDLGHKGPERETRVHVGIVPETQTSEEGRLFQTRGLEFEDLALVIETDANLADGLATLGGERRLVRWQKQETLKLPSCPNELRQKILAQKQCRLLLLTPAWFRNGYYPEDVMSEIAGVGVDIVASCVQRPQTVSGWEFLGKGRAKPTRRLAPAGSVYFLKLAGEEADIAEWIHAVWMHSISDINHNPDNPTRHPDQDRRDGFGLAVLGVWTNSVDKEPQS